MDADREKIEARRATCTIFPQRWLSTTHRYIGCRNFSEERSVFPSSNVFIRYIISVEWDYFNVRERGAKATVKVGKESSAYYAIERHFSSLVLAIFRSLFFSKKERKEKKRNLGSRQELIVPTPVFSKSGGAKRTHRGRKALVGCSRLSSFITRKRFKRSECQLVNIIIMTSNMGRSLHRITRAAPERPEYGQGLDGRGIIVRSRPSRAQLERPSRTANKKSAIPPAGLECFVRPICSV